MSKVQVIQIDNIIMDSTTQARAMYGPMVYDYAELMQDGTVFPPIVVFQDAEGSLWLADGFHRVAAAKEAGIKELQAEIHEGSQRDAILYSLGPANNSHGIALTRKERRERVTKLLQDPEWSQWSDREIARHCGVSHPTVAQIRRDTGKVTSERMGADGRVQTVKHWGHNYGMAFWKKVEANGLKDQDVLGMLQKGATHITDLKLTKDQTWHRLNQLAIEHHSKTWSKGDYVKHASLGRFGKVMDVTPDYLSVLNFNTDRQDAWMYDGCIKSSLEEWQAFNNRPVESDFHFGQVCHVWAKCTIWGFDVDGDLEPTMRHVTEGTRVEFVRAFQVRQSIFAEVNWGGSPTRIPLSALRAGEPPAPEADSQSENENPFNVGDRVVLEDQRAGTIRYIKGENCGVFFDKSQSTHYYHWAKLTSEPAESTAAIAPGQQVKAPSGQTGTVAAVSGNMVTVETNNGTHTYRDRHLTIIDDEQPAALTSEYVTEILPLLERALQYADGNTEADEYLASDIIVLLKWFDNLHEALLQEMEVGGW